jgi:hypothetical protein
MHMILSDKKGGGGESVEFLVEAQSSSLKQGQRVREQLFPGRPAAYWQRQREVNKIS